MTENKTEQVKPAFWAMDSNDAINRVRGNKDGLLEKDVARLRSIYGSNTVGSPNKVAGLMLFINQFKSPVTIILILASLLSFVLNDGTDGGMIILIVLFSSALGFWQERTAGSAIAALLEMVRITAAVVRDGKEKEIPVEQIVPGDIILLNAGDVIPADCLILESNELFVDEAAFTGETFPVNKQCSILPEETPLAKRTNSLFMGSHVVSGTARVLAMHTGGATEFGHISDSLKNVVPLTEFEIGVKKFGYLLMQITMILVLVIFAINVFLGKPPLNSFLFTLAIAVGLTPQLLPAIIAVNLALGAKRMADEKVIVKRLSSIENFGSMEVLCSDKTGTLTEGKVHVNLATDCFGIESAATLRLAKLNASLQQGFKNPIDEAISETNPADYQIAERLGEIPYDFIRKRLTLMVSLGACAQLITKGAVTQVLSICRYADDGSGNKVDLSTVLDKVNDVYQAFSAQGYRTLGVAYKHVNKSETLSREDEQDMIFAGFITMFDPVKKGIAETIATLSGLGIRLKVITGDNVLVAKSLSRQIGLKSTSIVSGQDLRVMSEEALRHQVVKADIFAEVEPNQKERIILALKKAGKIVGYLGDGINDASALHAADVGISVDTAVDVAKEAADIVLMNRDLHVLIQGVKEGRRTFANTQKYIFMATSANFGNMFSMAGASLFLSFLPLLPKQILLTNLLTDFPGMTLASDTVDENWVAQPRRWDINLIKRFMIVFGMLSSVFDYLTFGVLLLYFKAGEVEFQTGWFIESVISATCIVLVVRTRKSFLKSRPGNYLLTATVFVALSALLLPYFPFAAKLGFAPMPHQFYLAMTGIVIFYLLCAELLKKWFYKGLGKVRRRSL